MNLHRQYKASISQQAYFHLMEMFPQNGYLTFAVYAVGKYFKAQMSIQPVYGEDLVIRVPHP